MGTDDDRAASALDDLLQRAVRQGYLDPMAGRAARSGVDRLRTLLNNGGDAAGAEPAAQATAATTPGTAAEPVAATGPEAAETGPEAATAGAVPAGDGTVRVVVPLRGGRRAELQLPERFDGADAERIGRVVAALALDDDPQPAS